MNVADLSVGDVVVIRSWEDMKAEFGLTRSGNILCEFIFTKDMRYLCGRELVVRSIYGHSIQFVDNRNESWSISADMLELSSNYQMQQPRVEDFASILFGGARGNAT